MIRSKTDHFVTEDDLAHRLSPKPLAETRFGTTSVFAQLGHVKNDVFAD